MKQVANIPKPFEGTPEEAQANFETHSFSNEDARCMDCDCRAWGEYAKYPCGAEVERVWTVR